MLFVFQWYAIMLDYVGEYEGTKERISKAFKIKDHFMVWKLFLKFFFGRAVHATSSTAHVTYMHAVLFYLLITFMPSVL